VALAGALGLVTFAFSRLWIGIVAAAAAALVARVPRARWLVTLGAPVALVASRLAHAPDLAWLTLALLAVDLACGMFLERRRDA
jgi:hypothetical protein